MSPNTPMDDEQSGVGDPAEVLEEAFEEEIEHAAELLADLRNGAAEDAELVDGRDGRDVAAHLDASVRTGRAAYAVLHCVFEKETP